MDSNDWMLLFVVVELLVLAIVWLGERRKPGGFLVTVVVAVGISAAAAAARAAR